MGVRNLIVVALVLGTVSGARAAQGSLTFEQAADRGMVDMAANKPAAETADLIAHMKEIDPGIVDGFAFFFGGPTQKMLDSVGENASKIRAQVPDVLMVAGWSESVKADYNETLRCGGKLGDRHFTAEQLTDARRQTGNVDWIDMGKPDAALFYECVAQSYIDSGISVLRFEAPVLMLKYSTNPKLAERAFTEIAAHAKAYAASKGEKVYFIGDPALKEIHLDGVYVPSRFYHTSAFAVKYQNKISRPDVGIGYSYALSPRIVRDTVDSVPAGTRVFFDVDHWDSKQDDLRRFMELDAENRRYLILQSMRNAKKGGASFVPPLDTCGGCTPRSAVVDECEKPANPSPDYTEYNAIRCGDLATIREATHMAAPR